MYYIVLYVYPATITIWFIIALHVYLILINAHIPLRQWSFNNCVGGVRKIWGVGYFGGPRRAWSFFRPWKGVEFLFMPLQANIFSKCYKRLFWWKRIENMSSGWGWNFFTHLRGVGFFLGIFIFTNVVAVSSYSNYTLWSYNIHAQGWCTFPATLPSYFVQLHFVSLISIQWNLWFKTTAMKDHLPFKTLLAGMWTYISIHLYLR